MLTKQHLDPLENRSQTLIFWRLTYAKSDERTPLSLVQTYMGGPPDIRSANSTTDVHGTTRTYATFLNTFAKRYH
jgi:hypothetical protein